jgi:hypothetical protein
MPTIVSTAGGSTSNSFASKDEADAYCDAQLNADAWNDEDDDDQKARALIAATRELSSKSWIGQRVTSTQSLSWPRAWAQNPDTPWPAANIYYDSTIIPQRVKDATCELALQFLKAGTTDIAGLDANAQITRKVVGPLETYYAAPYERPVGLARFPQVTRFIAPLLCGLSNSAEVIRG